MLKYVATALALKCFSSNALTRDFYRKLGNTVGNKRRSSDVMPDYYPKRVKRMLRLQKQHNIVSNGDSILELGTGWLHWEALGLRLFYDVGGVLFDVWDNRQLDGLKNYMEQLRSILSTGFGLTVSEVSRAQSLAKRIANVESFDELYKLLGLQYVIEPTGSLTQFPSNTFQLVVSGGVLEHVKKTDLPALISETQRVLKPGGWAVHSIDTADHLEHYDRTVSPKMYLTFTEKTWARLFENEVQYINRMQRGEWLGLFEANGFDLIEEEAARVDITELRVADRYGKMERSDLECTVLKVALRKPVSAI